MRCNKLKLFVFFMLLAMRNHTYEKSMFVQSLPKSRSAMQMMIDGIENDVHDQIHLFHLNKWNNKKVKQLYGLTFLLNNDSANSRKSVIGSDINNKYIES